MRISAIVAATFLVGLALTSCGSLFDYRSGREPVNFAVGSNELGEECQVISAPADPQVPSASDVYNIKCGKKGKESWEEPNARIYRVSSGGDVQAIATTGNWRERLKTFVACPPGQPQSTTLFDAAPAMAFDCVLRIGQWPYHAVVVRAGDDVFMSDGIPVALPAVVRAIGALSGTIEVSQAVDDASMSAEIRRLEANLSEGRYTAEQMEHFYDMLRLAQNYNFEGQHALAERQYREALQLQKDVLPEKTEGHAFLIMHIGLELSNQREFDRAESSLKQAEDLLNQGASLERTDEPRLISYQAIHFANIGDQEKAIALARKATDKRRELAGEYGRLESKRDVRPSPGSGVGALEREQTPPPQVVMETRAETARGDIVQSLVAEATLLIQEERLEEAEKELEEAEQLLKEETQVPRRWQPQISLLRAQIAEHRGDLDSAEKQVIKGIAQQRNLFNISQTEGLAYLFLGSIYGRQDKSAAAFEAYRSGFAILKELGSDIPVDHALPYFQTVLQHARENADQRDTLTREMFETAQLLRGPIAAQTMARMLARLATDERVGQLIRDLQDARLDRDRTNEQLARARADEKISAETLHRLEKNWEDLNSDIPEIERQVQAAEPRYNLLVDKMVTLKETQEVLNGTEAIIQIVVGHTGGIGFFIRNNSIDAYPIPISSVQLGRTIEFLRNPLGYSTAPLSEEWIRRSNDLYQTLFGEVAGQIAQIDHLVVAPTGDLLGLPVAILLTKAPSGVGAADRGGAVRETSRGAERVRDGSGAIDMAGAPWMGKAHALSLTPSVQTFVILRASARPPRADTPFIGFGDFRPHEDIELLLKSFGLPDRCREQVRALASAKPLTNTRNEVEQVSRQFGGTAWLDADFAENRVRAEAARKPQILYFATHAFLPAELECFPEPGLLTSIPADADPQSDGVLTASEITELDLDASLVVLSACDTGGSGSKTGGESLAGLTRAFFYAGSRSVLASHWPVVDEPTRELMIRTFETFAASNVSLSESLRQAQMHLMRSGRWSHPVYWGAFTIVGDGGRGGAFATSRR